MIRTIAYVAGSFPSRSETFVYREVRALRQRGWKVQPVSLNEPAERGLNGFEDLEEGLLVLYGSGTGRTLAAAAAELLTHPLRSLATLATALRDAMIPGEPTQSSSRGKLLAQTIASLGLARRLRQVGVMHVHCHFAHAPATIGMYSAMQLGIDFSFTGHANDLFQRRILLKRKLQRAEFVACISRWHRDLYQEVEPDEDQRYRLIRCGVDTDGWAPAPRSAASRDTLRVLTVCRLVEKKGVDTLIRAVDDVRRRHRRECELTIAGDGPDRPRLVALAEQLQCTDALRWLGAVDNEQVRLLFDQADVFALPCRTDARGDRDGIPVVLMEAMACGVPVVAGDLPAIRELIAHGISGLLVNGQDVSALADHLVTLADDLDQRRRLTTAGRQRVVEEFALETNVNRLEQALSKGRSGRDRVVRTAQEVR